MELKDLHRWRSAWLSSVGRALSRTQESADLRSNHDETRKAAKHRSATIDLIWAIRNREVIRSLLQANTPWELTQDELAQLWAAIKAEYRPQHSVTQQRGMRIASRATNSGPGRPAAIDFENLEALILHIIYGKSYGGITRILLGECSHICNRCGDVKRLANDGRRDRVRRGERPCDLCNSIPRTQLRKRKVCDLCIDATRHRIQHLKMTLEELGVDARLLNRADLMRLPFNEQDLVWQATLLDEKAQTIPLEAN